MILQDPLTTLQGQRAQVDTWITMEHSQIEALAKQLEDHYVSSSKLREQKQQLDQAIKLIQDHNKSEKETEK